MVSESLTIRSTYLRYAEIRFEECDCEPCRGLMPQEIIDLILKDKEARFKILVINNLLDIEKH